MTERLFSLPLTKVDIHSGHVRMCAMPYPISWIIFILDLGTNCAHLVAAPFLYCYERDLMDSLNHDNQADVIEAFNSTSRYLDDLLNIDNPYFEGMVNQIYPSELQLNKANISDTEAPFLDLHLSVANGFVSSKIYDKRDDFDFDIVNFRFWMVTFLVVLLMMYTFRNLLGLLESAIMLQTSTLEIYGISEYI